MDPGFRRGDASGDARPKTKAAAIDAALDNGVNRVHVISYRVPDSLLLEIFTNEGTGTLVVNDIAALSAAEQASSGPLQ